MCLPKAWCVLDSTCSTFSHYVRFNARGSMMRHTFLSTHTHHLRSEQLERPFSLGTHRLIGTPNQKNAINMCNNRLNGSELCPVLHLPLLLGWRPRQASGSQSPCPFVGKECLPGVCSPCSALFLDPTVSLTRSPFSAPSVSLHMAVPSETIPAVWST